MLMAVMDSRIASCVALLLLVGLAGCRDAKPQAAEKPQRASGQIVTLRVLVVNDPPLAEAIERLRGEWGERSGGTLAATSKPWAEVIQADKIDVDLIVFPSRYLGELCVKDQIRPVRSNVLESETYDAADVFPLVSRELTRFDGRVMALPLGIELPVMCYRADYFEDAKRQVPENWDEYQAIIALFHPPMVPKRTVARIPIIWEPIETWAALVFLARAAPYAVHPDRVGILFDPESMEPRITDPPFIRALKELREASKDMFSLRGPPASGIERELEMPGAASWQVATGYAHCMAIGLPPDGHRAIVIPNGKLEPADGSERIGWTELPGSKEFYNASLGQWEPYNGGVHRVPVFGSGGRLAAVTTTSRNVASAFRLLAWLASAETSGQLVGAGDRTMACRRSQVGSSVWYDPALPRSERNQLAEVLKTALSREKCLVVPRIPGIDQYLAALDRAVQDAVSGRAEPDDALRQAYADWERITDRLGRENQLRAYRGHLNLPY
jgi:multiple sugar transport system substrate-binding protein